MYALIVELDTDDVRVASRTVQYISDSVEGRNDAIGELPCAITFRPDGAIPFGETTIVPL